MWITFNEKRFYIRCRCKIQDILNQKSHKKLRNNWANEVNIVDKKIKQKYSNTQNIKTDIRRSFSSS